MALHKTIKQPDGVVTTYHRVHFIKTVVNSHNSIAVLSYIDSEARQSENAEARPYRVSTTFETGYDESMTVTSAYDYLKTLPEFEDAIDV